MKRLPALPLIALALAAPVSAQQSVRDFQLPPAPTATASPNVQGPVDTEGAVPVVPRAIETDRPAPTPSPSPSPAPRQTPAPVPAPSRAVEQRPERTISQPQPPAAQTPVETPAPQATPSPDVAEMLPESSPELPTPPESMSAPSASPDFAPGTPWPWWIWLAAGLGLLAIFVLIGWAWRKRSAATVPEIMPPLMQASPEPDPRQEATPPPVPTPAPTEQTQPVASPSLPVARGIAIRAPLLEMETASLSRSVMALRLSYRLRITNPGGAPLEGLQLEGELAAAHSSAPIDAQRADPARALTLRNELPRLDPGETQVLKGEIVLPLSEIVPIMQGNVPLLVPLLLWRCTADGIPPAARTYLLGEVPETVGSRLRPYRLDQPPQGYPNLGLKALD